MKVLVTGGAGYIGSSLINLLEKIDSITEIVVYDNLIAKEYNLFLSDLNKSKKVKFVKGDILDNKKLSVVLQGVDTIYHLAAKTTEPDNDIDSHFFEQTNTWGSAILVNEAIKQKVKKIIYASSIYVYDYNEDHAITVELPNPKSFYGISKLRGEQHILSEEKIETIVLRIGNVFGINPTVRFNTLVNNFLFDAHFNGKVTIYGDGTQKRPFISIEDCAEVMISAIDEKFKPGIYNAATLNLSINEIKDALTKLYPDLKYSFVNKHIKMGSISVIINEKLFPNKNYNELFELQLAQMKKRLL